MKPIRSLIPILLIASVAAANSAQAETRIVSYADLDLASPEGQSTLDRRIAGAIRQVCGQVSPNNLETWYDVRRCRSQTRASVQAQRNDVLAQAQNHRMQLTARR